MNRRELMQLGVMAATAAAGTAHANEMQDRMGPGVSWDKAPCRFCGTGCHVQVGVEKGKVVGIAGDPKAQVNQGLLCVKGYHSALALYGKDRLTTPMLRIDGELKPISWERAINVIADRIEADPASFGIYGSGQWTIPEGYAAQKFIKGGLSNNHIDPNARLCMASAVTGFLAVYGVDEPAGCYADLDEADVVILWGNNPAEMHPILFSRIIDRRSRGEEVVVVDLNTRTTRSSAHAQHVIRFEPNTDLAVANGIAHLLLENGTWDQDFVEKHCAFRKDTDDKPSLFGQPSTFEEYKAALAEYTPEFVEQISGVSTKDLRLLAEMFGHKELRITSLWCMGVNQHTRGTAMNTLIHGLHLLSGHFGRPGDAPTSLTGQPSACGTAREVGTLAHALPGGRLVAKDEHRAQCEELWNLPAGRINAKPGFHTMEMWKQWSNGGGVKTIWVQVTNPGQTLPNRHAFIDPGVKDPDAFLIVSDVYPTATTEIADLVLPSAMWVEKNGVYGNSERRTQQWFKMVEPPGQARDDCWQIIAVARALFERGVEGMKDKDGRFLFEVDGTPIWKWERYYDVNVDQHLFEEYRGFTRLKHKDLAPYEEYVKARGLRWPVVEQEDGTWRETRFRFSAFDDPYVAEGKEFDFYHSPSKDGRAQIWFRPHAEAPEKPDADYPFWLCTGRVLEHWHSGSMTRRIPQLGDAMPMAYVEIHRQDAQDLGIANGETVRLVTRRGQLELSVWIDGRGKPPRGTVFVPFFDERLPINQLTLDAYDPISKQPDFKKCGVRIERIG